MPRTVRRFCSPCVTLAWLCGAMMTLASASAQSDPDPWKSLASEPEWRFTRPSLSILKIPGTNAARGNGFTWLHPVRNRSNWIEEVIMPGHEHEARAFAFHLIRVTPKRKGCSRFQPIDPVDPSTTRPAAESCQSVFPRSEAEAASPYRSVIGQRVFMENRTGPPAMTLRMNLREHATKSSRLPQSASRWLALSPFPLGFCAWWFIGFHPRQHTEPDC